MSYEANFPPLSPGAEDGVANELPPVFVTPRRSTAKKPRPMTGVSDSDQKRIQRHLRMSIKRGSSAELLEVPPAAPNYGSSAAVIEGSDSSIMEDGEQPTSFSAAAGEGIASGSAYRFKKGSLRAASPLSNSPPSSSPKKLDTITPQPPHTPSQTTKISASRWSTQKSPAAGSSSEVAPPSRPAHAALSPPHSPAKAAAAISAGSAGTASTSPSRKRSMGSLPPVLTVTELADDSVTASAKLFALGEDGDFDTWGGDSNTGLLSPGRAQITIGRVQALQQMFLAMEDRPLTDSELRAAPVIRRNSMVAPVHRASARRLSNRVAAEAARVAAMPADAQAPSPSMVIQDDDAEASGGSVFSFFNLPSSESSPKRANQERGGDGSTGGTSPAGGAPSLDAVGARTPGKLASSAPPVVGNAAAFSNDRFEATAAPPVQPPTATVAKKAEEVAAVVDAVVVEDDVAPKKTGKDAALAEIARIKAMRRVSATPSQSCAGGAEAPPIRATVPAAVLELYDNTVSAAFVKLVKATTTLAASDRHAATATEMLREGTFMQRQFLRIAPQVEPDHFEAKRIMHEVNELLIRARFFVEDVDAEHPSRAPAAIPGATVALIEAFGWIRIGRFANDVTVQEHVAKHTRAGLAAIANAESQYSMVSSGNSSSGGSVNDAAQQWAAAYRLIAEGLAKTTDAFHAPCIGWNSATPDADFEPRGFTPLPSNVGPLDAARIRAERSAFADRLAAAAADTGSLAVAEADFTVDMELGSGAFGKVLLVSQRTGGSKLALKVMVKANIMESLQAEQVLNESVILSCLDHPYIVKSEGSYQDLKSLYIALEYVSGGELMELMIHSASGCLSKDAVRGVVAETATALAYLHGLDVVFRDMKPENLLVDADGHIKLTDFGFAKRIRRGALRWTMCGTSEYMAPEVLLNSGQSPATDWWALGVLAYELRYAKSPFSARTEFETYGLILKAKYSIPELPESSQAEDQFVADLLQIEPRARLGPRGVEAHPYFRGLDWDRVRRREGVPPLPPRAAPVTKNRGDALPTSTGWTPSSRRASGRGGGGAGSGGDGDDGFGDTFKGF
eukprot:gene9271-16862_t